MARRSGTRGTRDTAGQGLLAGGSGTGGSERLVCKKRKEEEKDLRRKKEEHIDIFVLLLAGDFAAKGKFSLTSGREP